MILQEIVSTFTNNSRSDVYLIETFILNILKFHIENENKRFSLVTGIRGLGDAFAEDGFDEFKGKTVIDIRHNFTRMPIRFSVESYISQLANNQDAYANLIIIIPKEISEHFKNKIIKELSDVISDIKIIIWGPPELNKIINKHKKKADEIAKNLFSLRLETAVTDIGDWEQERESRLQELIKSYEKGQISLFLGAGISSSAGLPDWNTLLNSLFVSYLTKELNNQSSATDSDIKQIVDRLNTIDEPSALMAARYLRKGLSKQSSESKEFTKVITENLYKLRDKSKSINSNLIISISNLCMPRRTGAKVRSVITYNFDDLLERELHNKTIQHHSIYSDNEILDPDELPLYHVHGFLPEQTNQYESLEKSTLVFSEEGYHQIYTDAYHWSNLVQLANLRDNNCLMIGLSLTDPNLRRLLDISARNSEQPKHYAFMRRMSIKNFAYKKDIDGSSKKVIDNVQSAEDFLNRHHKLNEEILKELGVIIIWFKEFDELPPLLDRLR